MPETLQREEEQRVVSAPGAPTAVTPPAPSSRTGSIVRVIALLIFLGAAGVFAYFRLQSNKQDTEAAAKKTAAAANRAIPVTQQPVVQKTMPIYVTALGTVTAYNTVTIKSRVDGQLLSVNVREGQQVKQGQLLAVIDPSPYAAAEQQAEGQLAKDQASADYAKAEASRYTALFQAGVVSKESEQTQVSSAGASVGTLAADRAAIQAAKVNVAYTKILSPINGVVGLRQVDAGNIVHASDSGGLLVVTELQPIAVIFTLPEDQLPQVLKLIRGGHKLVAEAYDRSDATKLATGSLLTLDNEIDTTTGTVKAKAVFDNKDGALFPNQFVNVRLILEQRADSLVVPASAIQTGTGGNFVYVVKPGAGSSGKAKKDPNAVAAPAAPAPEAAAPADEDAATGAPKKKKFHVDVDNVVIDLTEGSQVIIKSGLKVGDMVVVDGQEKLKPGSAVEPKSATPGGKGGASGPQAADSGADGSTPNPDTGEGGLNEPGKHAGGHGGAKPVDPSVALPTDTAPHHHRPGTGNPE